MNVTEAIIERRSIKVFDPEHEMTEQEMNKLLALGMLSPTAFNIQHWRFVVVKDVALRKEIRAASWDQAQVTDASLLVIITVDLNAWEKDTARYWVNAPKAAQERLVPMIHGFYKDKEQVQRDEGMRSGGIAAQTLMLAAKEMGYDTCPMDGFDFDAVSKLINLPADHTPVMFVAVGKALEEARPRGGQLDMDEVVIFDKF